MITYEQRTKLVASYYGMQMLITGNRDQLEEISKRAKRKQIVSKELITEINDVIGSLEEVNGHISAMLLDLAQLDQAAVAKGEESAFDNVMGGLLSKIDPDTGEPKDKGGGL